MFEYRSLLDRPTFGFSPLAWDDVFTGFDRLLRDLYREDGAFEARSVANVGEQDGKVTIRVDVPGLSEKDVRVDFHDGVLSISAARTVPAPEGYETRRRERAPFQVSRSYSLGEGFDPEKTTAELRDGVLTVTVARAPQAQKKSITIKAA